MRKYPAFVCWTQFSSWSLCLVLSTMKWALASPSIGTPFFLHYAIISSTSISILTGLHPASRIVLREDSAELSHSACVDSSSSRSTDTESSKVHCSGLYHPTPSTLWESCDSSIIPLLESNVAVEEGRF